MAARTQRRSWDKYVKDAKEVYTEIEIGEDVVRIYIPSADAMEVLGSTADQWEQINALMGEENGNKLRELAGPAPVTALQGLISDIFSDLGLSDDRGE